MHSFMIFCPLRNGLVSNVFRRAKGRKSLILAGARKKVVSYDFILKKMTFELGLKDIKGSRRRAIQVEGTVPTGSHEGGKCRECQTRKMDSDPTG